MMRTPLLLIILLVYLFFSFRGRGPEMNVNRSFSLDSLGACQGAAYINGKVYLYGDREVGMIREYILKADSLHYTGKEIKLTQGGKDIINHPTGFACNVTGPTFIGNSIRLNAEGTLWKAVIYRINWEGLLQSGSLDGNLISTIEDDACIQGTRPEYIQYNHKWYVATADYGDKKNEVRLYDPVALKKAAKTREKGVLFKKFSCSPWVQNLHWIPEKGILVLVQNQIEGRRWRFTYLNLKKSIESGKEDIIKVIDLDKGDELEGFTLFPDLSKGIAVTSSRKENAHLININW